MDAEYGSERDICRALSSLMHGWMACKWPSREAPASRGLAPAVRRTATAPLQCTWPQRPHIHTHTHTRWSRGRASSWWRREHSHRRRRRCISDSEGPIVLGCRNARHFCTERPRIRSVPAGSHEPRSTLQWSGGRFESTQGGGAGHTARSVSAHTRRRAGPRQKAQPPEVVKKSVAGRAFHTHISALAPCRTRHRLCAAAVKEKRGGVEAVGAHARGCR